MNFQQPQQPQQQQQQQSFGVGGPQQPGVGYSSGGPDAGAPQSPGTQGAFNMAQMTPSQGAINMGVVSSQMQPQGMGGGFPQQQQMQGPGGQNVQTQMGDQMYTPQVAPITPQMGAATTTGPQQGAFNMSVGRRRGGNSCPAVPRFPSRVCGVDSYE